jgi:Flp pilus assembly protein TadG
MRLRRLLARVRDDRRGTSLIEFAILLPVLTMMFIGGYQLSDASACKRRVTIVSRAMVDLVSQYAVISGSQVDTILAASTQIMAPYDANIASVRVTQVTTNVLGYPTVSWSRARNGTALATGSYFNLPLTMRLANSSVLYAEVTYTYQPAFGKILSPITFTQDLYMLPRVSNSVTFNP